MRAFRHRLAALVFTLLSSSSFSAFGQDGGVTLTISNDTSDILLVSIYDLGSSPRQQILANRPIYGGASLTVSITEDESGKGHLWWSAMTQDRDMRTCGHDDKAGLNDGDTVSVYAGGDCAG
jgi:hypothetical protein